MGAKVMRSAVAPAATAPSPDLPRKYSQAATPAVPGPGEVATVAAGADAGAGAGASASAGVPGAAGGGVTAVAVARPCSFGTSTVLTSPSGPTVTVVDHSAVPGARTVIV